MFAAILLPTAFAGSLIVMEGTTPAAAISTVSLATRETLTDVRFLQAGDLRQDTPACDAPPQLDTTIAAMERHLVRVDYGPALDAHAALVERLACLEAPFDPALAARAWFLAGYAAFEEGQEATARAHYAQAARFDPAIEWDETYRMEGVPLLYAGREQAQAEAGTTVRLVPAVSSLRVNGVQTEAPGGQVALPSGRSVLQSADGHEVLAVLEASELEPDQAILLDSGGTDGIFRDLTRAEDWATVQGLLGPLRRSGEEIALVVGDTVFVEQTDGTFKRLSTARERVPRYLTWTGAGLAVLGGGAVGLQVVQVREDQAALDAAQGSDEAAYKAAVAEVEAHRRAERLAWGVVGAGAALMVTGELLQWRGQRSLSAGLHALPGNGWGLELSLQR